MPFERDAEASGHDEEAVMVGGGRGLLGVRASDQIKFLCSFLSSPWN